MDTATERWLFVGVGGGGGCGKVDMTRTAPIVMRGVYYTPPPIQVRIRRSAIDRAVLAEFMLQNKIIEKRMPVPMQPRCR